MDMSKSNGSIPNLTITDKMRATDKKNAARCAAIRKRGIDWCIELDMYPDQHLDIIATLRVRNYTEDDQNLLEYELGFEAGYGWDDPEVAINLFSIKGVQEAHALVRKRPKGLSAGCVLELDLPEEHAVKTHKRTLKGGRTLTVKGHRRGRVKQETR